MVRFNGKYLVHDERRFVYFVTQKVACSSIKTALLPLFDVNTERYWSEDRHGNPVINVHRLFNQSGYQIDKKELVSQPDKYRDHFKFAFVRNPYDRLVSCWLQKLTNPGDRKPEALGLRLPGVEPEENPFYPEMSFAEFVEVAASIPDERANPHFRSQHAVLCSDDGALLPDFTGRFENLAHDFGFVARKIGAPGLTLPHRLRSEGRDSKHYSEFYDEKSRGLAEERFARDLDLFGYSFQESR